MINRFFDEPIKSVKKQYSTNSCLLDYLHSKEDYKLIVIDLSKQWAAETTMCFTFEEARTILGFSIGTVVVL